MNAISLALLAVLFWGVAPVFDKAGIRDISPALALTIRSFVVGAAMLIFFLATGQSRELAHAKPSSIVYMVLSAVCASLIGQVLYFAALKRGEASTIVPVVGAYPLVAALLGVLVLGEDVTLFKALGAILVVSGVALLRMQR